MNHVKRTALLIVTALISISYGFSGGDGTPSAPFEISTIADWQELIAAPADWDMHFQLINDIDFGGMALTPVAPDPNTSHGFQGTPFTGVFDGNGHVLRNATINMSVTVEKDHVGLFGYLDTGGQIRDLGVEDMNVTGRNFVGGLVGYNYSGTITSCYATGSVTGFDDYVGGLVGYNHSGTIISCYTVSNVGGHSSIVGGLIGINESGTIISCYASGDVGGLSSIIGGLIGINESGTITLCYAAGDVSGFTSSIGGLLGINESGTITSCYAMGDVSGTYDIGGLVGKNYSGAITACYAAGNVSGTSYSVGGLIGYNYYSGTITASFWDRDTSGRNSSAAGKGLTTVQMKTMSIFQNAGWSQYAWVMEDGQDYPRLAWENTTGLPIPPTLPVPLSGCGTQNDPFLVQTPSEFALLSWHVSILDKHLKLTADIDLTGVLLYPIGDLGPFTGDFDGAGHVIRNAVINQPTSDYVGLFDSVASGGQIRDLGVEDVDITGRNYVGGLVGYNSSGTIISCYATGDVSGLSFDGGIVGYNYSGMITACYAIGAVTGTGSDVGGLVGRNDYGAITACHTMGNVSGDRYVGGLVGYNYGTIISCYSAGDVNRSSYGAGGLVGYNDSCTITSCCAAGDINGSPYFAGGLVGRNDHGAITACYAAGNVSGNRFTGGLVGENDEGTFTSCYATGDVSGSSSVGGLVGGTTYGTIEACYALGDVNGILFVGGLVGLNYRGKITHCFSIGQPTGNSEVGGLCGSKVTSGGYADTGNFWDTDTSQTTTSAMGTGRTTNQMKTRSTFTAAGWDFVVDDNGTQDLWRMCIDGIAYPKLYWQFPSGDFTCPDGIELFDLYYFCNQWLMEGDNLRCDIAPPDAPDGVVNLLDWSEFARGWLTE